MFFNPVAFFKEKISHFNINSIWNEFRYYAMDKHVELCIVEAERGFSLIILLILLWGDTNVTSTHQWRQILKNGISETILNTFVTEKAHSSWFSSRDWVENGFRKLDRDFSAICFVILGRMNVSIDILTAKSRWTRSKEWNSNECSVFLLLGRLRQHEMREILLRFFGLM